MNKTSSNISIMQPNIRQMHESLNTHIKISPSTEYFRCVTQSNEFTLKRVDPKPSTCSSTQVYADLETSEYNIKVSAFSDPYIYIERADHALCQDMYYSTLTKGCGVTDIDDVNIRPVRVRRAFISPTQRAQRSKVIRDISGKTDEEIINLMRSVTNSNIELHPEDPELMKLYRNILINSEIESPQLASYIAKNVTMQTAVNYSTSGVQANTRNMISFWCNGHFDEFVSALRGNTENIPGAVLRLVDEIRYIYVYTGALPTIAHHKNTESFEVQYLLAKPIYVTLPANVVGGNLTSFSKTLKDAFMVGLGITPKENLSNLCYTMMSGINMLYESALKEGTVCTRVCYKHDDFNTFIFKLIAHVDDEGVYFEFVNDDPEKTSAITEGVLEILNASICHSKSDVGYYMYTRYSRPDKIGSLMVYTPDYIASVQYVRDLSRRVGCIEGETVPFIGTMQHGRFCTAIGAANNFNGSISSDLERFQLCPAVIEKRRSMTAQFILDKFDPLTSCMKYKGYDTEHLLFRTDPVGQDLLKDYDTTKKAYAAYKKYKGDRLRASNSKRLDYQQCMDFYAQHKMPTPAIPPKSSHLERFLNTCYIQSYIMKGMSKRSIDEYLQASKYKISHEKLEAYAKDTFNATLDELSKKIARSFINKHPVYDINRRTLRNAVVRVLVWCCANRNARFHEAYINEFVKPHESAAERESSILIDYYVRVMNIVGFVLYDYLCVSIIEHAGYVINDVGVKVPYNELEANQLPNILGDLSKLESTKSEHEYYATKGNIHLDSNKVTPATRVAQMFNAVTYFMNLTAAKVTNILQSDMQSLLTKKDKRSEKRKMKRADYKRNVYNRAITLCTNLLKDDKIAVAKAIEESTNSRIGSRKEKTVVNAVINMCRHGHRNKMIEVLEKNASNGYTISSDDILSIVFDRYKTTSGKQEDDILTDVIQSMEYLISSIKNNANKGGISCSLPQNITVFLKTVDLRKITSWKTECDYEFIVSKLSKYQIAEIGAAAYTCHYFYEVMTSAQAIMKLAADKISISPKWQDAYNKAAQLSTMSQKYSDIIQQAVQATYNGIKLNPEFIVS